VLVLRLGLTIAAITFVGSFVLGLRAGFPAELAVVRAVLAFMAVSFVAYLGELIVATAPMKKAANSRAESGEGTEDTTVPSADDVSETLPQVRQEPLRFPVPDIDQQAA